MTARLPAPPHTPSRVSVIIPVRNAESTLGTQLELLAAEQLDVPWEVVIADNGSSDGSEAVARGLCDRFPDFVYVDASNRRGPAHARNEGAAAASGDLLCFTDADDEIEPGWLGALVAGAADHHLVAGRLDVDRINAAAVRASRATPLTARDTAPPFAPSGNLAIWADSFRAVGGFDETLRANEDVELTQRLLAAGATMGWAADAVVHYRFRGSGWAAARQAFRSAWFQVALRARRGEPLAAAGSIGRQLWWLVTRAPGLVASAARRARWSLLAGSLAGELSAALWWTTFARRGRATRPSDAPHDTTGAR